MNRKKGFWIALWAVLVVVSGVLAFGHGTGGSEYGWWHGGHPMRGCGEAGRAWFTPGWHGMGPGMYGMAGGMMPIWPRDMTPEQERKARRLQGEAEESSRVLVQRAWEAQASLNKLYASDTRDWNAIRAAAKSLSDVQRQQMEAAIDLQQRVDALLSDSQAGK